MEASAPVAPEKSTPAMAAAPVAAPKAAPVASVGLPKVQSYALPVQDMTQIATSSGLEWVGSNPAKIAAVQAQIAAEPKPVHVPRERPPVVEVKNEPLVMVETKRDLGA
jgi:ribonuclease E